MSDILTLSESFRLWRIRKFIRNGGNPEAAIPVVIGKRPEPLNPVENYRHGRWRDVVNERLPIVENLREDLREVVAKMSSHRYISPWLLRFVLPFLLAGEFAGALLIMPAIGIEEATRAVPAFMLACIVFALVQWAARARIHRLVALTACGLIIVALGAVRANEIIQEDESPAVAIALLVIGVALSVGPAALAEAAMRRLHESVELSRKKKAIECELRGHENEVSKADSSAMSAASAPEEWDMKAAWLRAWCEAVRRNK
ncbi:MAG: hypothetical protein HY645_13545 [Acidobacteria bacterium]|nr:hypothetical protein [Acidobacteriota bacterium]